MAILRRHWLLRPLAASTAAAATWLGIELAAWVLLWAARDEAPVGRWEFRGARPVPYQDAAYFGPEFLDESMRCVRLGSPPGACYLVGGDFEGHFIHVEGGRRRTTDAPANADRRVLLFGGSTVFGQEVPDEATLASCLQRALTRQAGPRFRVENYGTPAMIARQQTARLVETPLRAGDVVVFYDGVNDVFYPVYNGNPEGYRIGDSSDGGVRKLSGAQAWLYPLCFRLKDHSCAAALVFRGMDGPRPAVLVESDVLAGHLDAAEAGYLRALTEARASAESRQARFLHVQQPHLFSRAEFTNYERRVARNELRALPGLDEAFRLGDPRLGRAAQAAVRAGMVHVDLTDALDTRSGTEEFYLDFCHVNHAANERLAKLISQHLLSY
jgi:hypothetical protein